MPQSAMAQSAMAQSAMVQSAGLQALAAALPDRALTNEHWRQHHPDLVARVEQQLWMWKKSSPWQEGSKAFDEAMEPYLDDPFRGARLRRVLPEGASVVELEANAARQAMAALGVGADDIDLLICSSFLPDVHGVGGATFLARELGLRGAAWNLESACSSALIALQTACSLVSSGLHRRVLVVTSCAYSRVTRQDDPIRWGVGDGAVAMIVGAVDGPSSLLGSYSVHSAETCQAVAYHLEEDERGNPCLRMRTGRQAARLLRQTSERYLRECTEGALARAGLGLDEIDHFVFATPLAWYARFCAGALGIDPAKALGLYPLYANVGPCLMGLGLLHTAHWRALERGQKVLLYTVGSVSSCAASVLRWDEVALGALPAGVSPSLLAQLENPAVLDSSAPSEARVGQVA